MRPAIKVGLSTASVYPLRTEAAFEYSARLGYDGVELMVWAETVSQDVKAVAKMSEDYDVPVLSVHAPCLLISQRVWGANPIPKLERSVRAAEELGAQTVVVHPPFRWQRRYAEGFSDHVCAVEHIPFDPALKSGALRLDNLRAPTRDAWIRVAAAAARGL